MSDGDSSTTGFPFIPPLRDAVDWVGRKAKETADRLTQKYRRKRIDRATRLIAVAAIAYLLFTRD